MHGLLSVDVLEHSAHLGGLIDMIHQNHLGSHGET